MKKFFLLLTAGISMVAANAQENQSIVIKQGVYNTPSLSHKSIQAPKRQASNVAAKQTGTQSGWFSFQDASILSGTSQGNLYDIYNDTSILVTEGTPPYHWPFQGFGTSFDATSTVFSPAGFRNTASQYIEPTFAVSSTNAYTVDSISILGYYRRQPYNNYVDTLNIWVAIAPNTGVLLLQNSSGSQFGVPNGIFHLASAAYDSATNTLSKSQAPSVIKYTKILDAAAFADSVGVGVSNHQFNIPVALSVPAGSKIVAYEQYISGHKYPFNHSFDSTNMWQVAVFQLNGPGTYGSQANNDFNCGLVMTGKERYDVDTQAAILSGTQFVTSGYFFASSQGPSDFQDPYFAFHINCATCYNVGVANVAKVISSANAYPNPANGEVYIPFTLSENANVNVTIVNTLGQVANTQSFNNVKSGKAAFNTSAYPAGIYFYTVEANGERNTGRFVVAQK